MNILSRFKGGGDIADQIKSEQRALFSDRSLARIQWLVCAAALLIFAFCIAKTFHWQIIWDQSVIRYVRFLMSCGLRPYADITDMNMPGSYLLEVWGMSLFGSSDLSWRLYEYVLILAIATSGAVIGGRRLQLTGVIAATLFLLVRFAEGEQFSLERNEIMAMLDLAALALFVLALERRRSWLLGASSALICLATSIKPWGYLLQIFLLGLAIVTLKRQRVPLPLYLLWAAAGNLLIAAILIAFMLHEHALGGFLFVMRQVWPLFRNISPHQPLLSHLVPRPLIPLTLLAAVAAYRNRSQSNWKRWALLLSMLAGAFQFKVEGSPVGYHRYVFVAFLATWIGWELTLAVRQRETTPHLIGLAGLLLLFAFMAPYYMLLIQRVQRAGIHLEQYPAALHADLVHLGGDRLQGQVECLDMLEGCLRALYQTRLVQNTGTTGDLFLFSPIDAPAVRYYQTWYTATQVRNPANVLILGNFWFQSPSRSFNKLDAWPTYATFVRANYVPVIERHFGDPSQPAYRIYLRKNSAVLAAERIDPLR